MGEKEEVEKGVGREEERREERGEAGKEKRRREEEKWGVGKNVMKKWRRG